MNEKSHHREMNSQDIKAKTIATKNVQITKSVNFTGRNNYNFTKPSNNPGKRAGFIPSLGQGDTT